MYFYETANSMNFAKVPCRIRTKIANKSVQKTSVYPSIWHAEVMVWLSIGPKYIWKERVAYGKLIMRWCENVVFNILKFDMKVNSLDLLYIAGTKVSRLVLDTSQKIYQYFMNCHSTDSLILHIVSMIALSKEKARPFIKFKAALGEIRHLKSIWMYCQHLNFWKIN